MEEGIETKTLFPLKPSSGMFEESVPNVEFCFWNLESVWNDENMQRNIHVEMKITGEQQLD